MQSSLALLSRVAGDSFGSSGAWGSHVSRTPRNPHGTRKSRRTHGAWGPWGPSRSLGPVAARLSEGVGQKRVPMLGDPGVGWSNRGWGPRRARRAWGPWRSPLSRDAHSSSLARAPWGALQTWWASHPHWAPAARVSLGASRPRKPPGTRSIISREQRGPLVFSGSRQPSEASIPGAALDSWGTPERGGVLRGSWGRGHCPLGDSQHLHLGLQHLQPLRQLQHFAAVETT